MTGSQFSGIALARWCVYLIAGLVPVAASYYPGFSDSAMPFTYDQYALVKFALVVVLAAVGLAGWLVHAATAGVALRRLPRVEYVVGALLAWSVTSVIFSVHPPTAMFGAYGRFEGAIALVAYAAVAFVTLQVLDTPTRLRELASVFVLSGSVVALYGILQSFGVLRAPEGTLLFETARAFSTYGNPNMLGLFLLIPVALSLGLALSEPEQRLRVAYWAAFAFNSGALVLTFTRAAWLSAAVALVFMGLTAWRLRVRFTRADAALSGVVLLGLVALGARSVTSGASVTNVVQRFLSLFDAGSGSMAERVAVWSGTLSAVSERPLLGFGPDTILLVWDAYATRSASAVVAQGQVDSAHSLPLQLAAGIGVIGAALYLVAVVMMLILGVRTALLRGRAPGVFLLAAYCAALGSLLLASLVSVTDVGLGVLIWLLAAAVAVPSATRSDRRVELPLTVSAGAAALLVVLGFGLAGTLVAADHAMARARVEAGTELGLEWAQRAVARSPWNQEYRLELGFQHQDRFLALSERGEMQLAAESFGQAEDVLIVLTELNPAYLDGQLALAELYLWGARLLDGGYADKAMTAAERARERAPGSPRTIGAMGLALAAQGRAAEAETVLREGLEIMPDNTYLQDLLGLISDDRGSE